MKKIIVFSTLILVSLLLLVGCKYNKVERGDTNNQGKVIDKVKVTINDKTYIINLEDNDTAQKLGELAPFEVTMKDLNGYEKYVYLASSFPVHPYEPNEIKKGDVMLFDNSCVVIFYKSVNLPFSYTKIGHIDNLNDLGNEDVIAKFERINK